MKEAMTRTFKSSLYQIDYKIWNNQNNPHAKAKAKKNMAKQMTDVYNRHRISARNSVIFDFNLHERAHELREQFGGNPQ